ncbi:MAG: queuosine precursor transporter [Oscillospiraceae bacterium]|nr:queuosine precursor transporter [Oscillospiraceae bacterium]
METQKTTGTNTASPILVYLVAIYTASLLTANILANHMIVVIHWTTTAGILTFPITYILASVLAEVYGYKWARRAAWLSLALSALLALLIQLSLLLPQPEWYDSSVFAEAIGGTWRIVVASLIAFTLGKFVNDKAFYHLKQGRKGMQGFTFRAMASSLGGHIVDTTIFTLVAFAGVIPWDALPAMIILQVCLKWGYEWIALPLTIKVVKWISRKESAYRSGT